MAARQSKRILHFDDIIAIIKPYLEPIVNQILENNEKADETFEYSSFDQHIRHAQELSKGLSIQPNTSSSSSISIINNNIADENVAIKFSANDIETMPIEDDYLMLNIETKSTEEATKHQLCPGCNCFFKNVRGLKRHAKFCGELNLEQKELIRNRKPSI